MKTSIDTQYHLHSPSTLRNAPSAEAASEAKQTLSDAGHLDVLEVTPSISGWSGMQCFEVSLKNGMGHLKMTPKEARLDPDVVFCEFHNAQWASEKGLGPKVMWADTQQQALLTARIVDETKASQGTRFWGPATKATVRSLSALHRSEQGPVTVFDHAAYRQKIECAFDQAKKNDVSTPVSLESVRALAHQYIDELKRFPVKKTLCHNDMNGCNSLYTKEQVYLIDWESMRFDDPIFELANFAYHVGCEMPQLPTLWRTYTNKRSLRAPEFEQLRLQLALFHCERYALRVTGMPWDQAEHREQDLEKFKQLLFADAALLGFVPPQVAGSPSAL